MGRDLRIVINDASSGEIARGINIAVRAVIEDLERINWQEILTGLIPYLEELHDRRFRSESGPDGSPWEPLSPYTIAKKGFSRVLIESGMLRASLGSRGPGAIRMIRTRELVFGTSVPYAGFHQEGFRNARTNTAVPARPMVGVGSEEINAISERVADAIVRKL